MDVSSDSDTLTEWDAETESETDSLRDVDASSDSEALTEWDSDTDAEADSEVLTD